MQRVCFLLRIKPEHREEYLARHEAVWPEMLDALRRTGWRNYSLFIAEDGLVVGYLETDDFDAAVARAYTLGALVVLDVHRNPNANHRELWIRDPDGYLVVIASPDGDSGGVS